MGFRAGRGAASAIRRAEVWKLREASARPLLNSILEDMLTAWGCRVVVMREL